MARENFISDHLVDMRDRLKQNYAESAHQRETPAVEPEAAKNDARPPRTAGENLPLLKGLAGTTETDRERRDLEGRLRRDLAAAEVLSARLQRQIGKTEEYQRILQELLEQLSAIGAGENMTAPEYARTIEQMRLQYFQSFGRHQAESAELADAAEGKTSGENTSGRNGPLLIAASIVIAALLVSTAILVSLAL